ELVGIAVTRMVLERVGVHGVEAEPQALGRLAQQGRVGLVPRDVERDGGRGAGETLDDGAVGKLVEDVARLAGPGETREPRAACTHAPRRDGDAEGSHLFLDGVDGDAAPVELLPERLIVAAQRLNPLF